MPAATGPRLQSGDLLNIGGRQCRIKSLLKTKAVCAHFGGGRDFTVVHDYALAHRCRAPRLPHTIALLAALRKGVPGAELLASAMDEGHVDALDRQGCTALLLAVQHGQAETVRTLLAHGARAELADVDDGETPLMKAAKLGHADIVSILVGHSYAMVDTTTAYGGFTALMMASAAGRLVCVHELLRARASVDVRERSTRARSDAMRLACFAGHVQVARLLAQYGATPPLGLAGAGSNAGSASARIATWLHATARFTTPLHHLDGMEASRARELLRDGADVHARGSGIDDLSPLDVATAVLADGIGGRNEAAATVVVSAARPWSPANHELFPHAERAVAFELLLVGARLGAEHGDALSEVWREVVVPAVVERRAVGVAEVL